MIEYIKMAIIALVCGFMAPLPTSSSAHFSLLSSAVNLTSDAGKSGFYFAIFSITFSLMIFINLRKIYFKTVKSIFSSKKAKSDNQRIYKSVAKKLLYTVLPMVLLFLPVGDGTIVIDYFDKFLTVNGLYLTGIACIINALVLVIARWYTKQENRKLKRVSGTGSAMRMSVYQLVSYLVPGFSHISSGATNMLISDVHPKVIMREVYLYIAPSMFVVNLAKIVRYLINDTIVDVVSVVIGAVVFSAVSFFVIKLIAKFNTTTLLRFFSVYSAVLGIGILVFAFII